MSNEIEREIMAAMRECMDENEEVLRQRCEDAGRQAVAELKANSRKRSGKYAKGWTYKVEASEAGTDCTVHNRIYQLTHLLENDHVIKNQTGKQYGIAPGDKVIAGVAERIGEQFAAGSDTQ